MSDKKQSNVITDPGSAIGDAKDLLTKLWRIIMHQCGMDSTKFNRLMERHLNDPAKKIPAVGPGRSNERGNMSKDLLRDTMTWRAFEDAIKWLRPVKTEFIVRLTWPNKKTTEHSILMVSPDVSDLYLGQVSAQPTQSEAESAKEAESTTNPTPKE